MKYLSVPSKLNMTLPLVVFFLIFVSGCSTTSTSKNDPLEPMNRAIFGFNEVLDKVLKETSTKALEENKIKAVPVSNGT